MTVLILFPVILQTEDNGKGKLDNQVCKYAATAFISTLIFNYKNMAYLQLLTRLPNTM